MKPQSIEICNMKPQSVVIHNLLEKNTFEVAQLLIAVNEIEHSRQNQAQLNN